LWPLASWPQRSNTLGSSGVLLLVLVDLDVKVGQEATSRTTVQDNVITAHKDGGLRKRRKAANEKPKMSQGKSRSGWFLSRMQQGLTDSAASPDIASIDARGQPTVYDVVITGVRARTSIRGAAARNTGIKNHKHYDSHKQACREAGSTGRRLDSEMIRLYIYYVMFVLG
jgi:hypothetical protein